MTDINPLIEDKSLINEDNFIEVKALISNQLKYIDNIRSFNTEFLEIEKKIEMIKDNWFSEECDINPKQNVCMTMFNKWNSIMEKEYIPLGSKVAENLHYYCINDFVDSSFVDDMSNGLNKVITFEEYLLTGINIKDIVTIEKQIFEYNVCYDKIKDAAINVKAAIRTNIRNIIETRDFKLFYNIPDVFFYRASGDNEKDKVYISNKWFEEFNYIIPKYILDSCITRLMHTRDFFIFLDNPEVRLYISMVHLNKDLSYFKNLWTGLFKYAFPYVYNNHIIKDFVVFREIPEVKEYLPTGFFDKDQEFFTNKWLKVFKYNIPEYILDNCMIRLLNRRHFIEFFEIPEIHECIYAGFFDVDKEFVMNTWFDKFDYVIPEDLLNSCMFRLLSERDYIVFCQIPEVYNYNFSDSEYDNDYAKKYFSNIWLKSFGYALPDFLFDRYINPSDSVNVSSFHSMGSSLTESGGRPSYSIASSSFNDSINVQENESTEHDLYEFSDEYSISYSIASSTGG